MPREDRDYRTSRDDDRSFRSRERADDDDDRDVLGRRRGGWFGDPERHAEIGRRSFEAHARAFGLPEDSGGRGGRSRMAEDRGGYRMREDERGSVGRGEREDDRGHRMREDERGGGFRMRVEREDERGYRARGRDEDRRPASWYDEVERRRGLGGRGRDEDEGYRTRGRDEDDDRGYRSRSEDDERDRLGRRKGGWFGDPEGHSRAVRLGRDEERTGYRRSRDDDDRGYRMRGRDEDDDRGTMMRGADEDDERDRLGRRKGGWFGDPEGHSEAARRRWDRSEGRE
jgi:hypothetical protein